MRKYFPVFVLASAMIFFAYDIIIDIGSGGDSYFHIVIELIVVELIVVSVCCVWANGGKHSGK